MFSRARTKTKTRNPRHMRRRRSTPTKRRTPNTTGRSAPTSKSHHVKLAALGPLNPPVLKLASSPCEPAKFRIAVDVGHTVESEGAASSRNVPEFSFNLRLAQQIAESLKGAGFAATRLLVTEGKAKPSLFK